MVKRKETFIFSRYISLIMGILSLIIGTSHYILFGFGWKNIPLIIIGVILLHSLVSEYKKPNKIKEGKKYGKKR